MCGYLKTKYNQSFLFFIGISSQWKLIDIIFDCSKL